MSLRAKLLTLCAILVLCNGAPAWADDPTQPQITPVATQATDPVHDLITSQMNAIRTRNADLAYANTTDGFHKHYDDAKNFLSHMRFEQRVLYNHKEFSFLDRHEMESGGVLQKVRVKDSYDNEPATVIFHLQQQEDGLWLIDSFTVLDSGGDARPI